MIAVAAGAVLYLASTGWQPGWAMPSCAEATAQGPDLRRAVLEGSTEAERTWVVWRQIAACNPAKVASVMDACDRYDAERRTDACRDVPSSLAPPGLWANLSGWIPTP